VNERYRVLLIVALALAAVRFVVVPWVDHQGERRDSLQVLTQRLDRSEGLVEARETILKQSTTLTAAAQAARTPYPVALNSDEFRLLAQQQLSMLAQESGIIVTVFDVLLEGEQKEANLQFVRVRLQLEGALNRMARFHGEIEGRLPYALLKSLRIDSSYPIAGPGDPTVQGSLTADLYFAKPIAVAAAGVSP
jgi:hypothetical protein